MSAIFFRQFGMSQPDINFGVGSGTQAEQTAAVMTAYERLCVSKPAAWTIVVRDVNATMACAIVAAKLGQKLAHLEAAGSITANFISSTLIRFRWRCSSGSRRGRRAKFSPKQPLAEAQVAITPTASVVGQTETSDTQPTVSKSAAAKDIDGSADR